MHTARSLAAVAMAAAILPLAHGGAVAAGAPRQASAGAPAALAPALVRRLSAGATERSIILFRNRLAGLPARGATTRLRVSAARADQAPVLAELRRLHARHVRSFAIINAIAATISPAEAGRLRANRSVLAVVPDAVRHFAPLGSGPGPAVPPALAHGAAGSAQRICPANPASPIVEPEARTVMDVPAANRIVTGAGVKVGIIADGIDPDNPDLIRANGRHVIFDYEDFSGFGTSAPTDGREAFLDAGSIAAQGRRSYDLSGFVNPAHPLPHGCTIKIKGLAPGASLAVLNVAGPNPGFFNSQIIQAIQWAVMTDHVNVLNESIGGNPFPDTRDDPVALADQAAVAAGVTVVASSGDAGPFSTIGSPASSPGVIDVGATTTYRVYRQTTRYGTQLVPGGWENDNISALSSSGTTQFGPATVSVVAPGDRGWSLCSSDTAEFFGCADVDHGTAPPPIWAAGGTSASAPETSAVAALVIEAYKRSHGGAAPSPGLVERIIVSTATDLGAPADHQGAGLVNALRAVQLAQSVGTSHRHGSTLLLSAPSLSATVTAGHGHAFSVGVTNEGTAQVAVTPSASGRPVTTSMTAGTARLSSSSPTYVDGEGNTDFYALRRFTVPRGADYLTGNITWNAASAATSVFETLFDPSGRVAAYSLLGVAASGFGHVEVRAPEAGTWTAVIFTIRGPAVYRGPVQFSYATERFRTAASVLPVSLRLAPGASGTIRVLVPPGPAGDQAISLHLGTGGGAGGAVPVLLRSLVAVGPGGGSFSGTLTGGADTGSGGQQFTYQFPVSAGRPELNLAVRLADTGYPLWGFLDDPAGDAVDVQSTDLLGAGGKFLGYGRTLQFFQAAPTAGQWTLTLLSIGPVNGARLSEPFTGALGFTRPEVTSTGLPASPGRVLRQGRAISATIEVVNNGAARKDFFADPRLDSRAILALHGTDTRAVPLPLSLTNQPNWLVPPGTNDLAVIGLGTAPITMDVSTGFGDPDALGASAGNSSVVSMAAPQLPPGLFFALPEATGPFSAGRTHATVDLAAAARTYRFDPATSSSTGDIWKLSVLASVTFRPLSLHPGASGRIRVTIRPTARPGSVIRGFVAVDTFSPGTVSGDQVAVIPYAYTVGAP